MTLVDEQHCRLLRAAVKARSHQFALNLVISLASINSVSGLTSEQRADIAAADLACLAADKALIDCEAVRFAPEGNTV
jgi:hypothetical protein